MIRVPQPTEQVEQFGGRRTSPDLWHVAREGLGSDLSWCGTGKQYAHLTRWATTAEATCPACQRRLRLGRPLSRGARS